MELSVLLNLRFHCTHQIFINHRWSATLRIIMHIFASLPLNHSWHVLHTPHKVDDECQPVSCFLHSRNGLQTAFHVRWSSRFLEHFKHTGRCIKWFDCLQIASVPSKRTNKLCMHAHHSDRSVAAAIFANGTYFVDTPHPY
jgi:hypothetical protein